MLGALVELKLFNNSSTKRAFGKHTPNRFANRSLWIVCNYCAFLHERGKLLVNPAADFPRLRRPQRLPKGVLTHAQMLRLLAQPDTQTLTGYRDRAALETLYSCGLRGLELCKLTIYDLDLSARTLRVLRGKGGKDRLVFSRRLHQTRNIIQVHRHCGFGRNSKTTVKIPKIHTLG